MTFKLFNKTSKLEASIRRRAAHPEAVLQAPDAVDEDTINFDAHYWAVVEAIEHERLEKRYTKKTKRFFTRGARERQLVKAVDLAIARLEGLDQGSALERKGNERHG